MTKNDRQRMVNEMINIIGYDFFAEDLNKPVDMWCDDDNPTPYRILPSIYSQFLLQRLEELRAEGIEPKSLYDFI